MLVESSGYRTRVNDSAASASATALTKSPLLKSRKLSTSGVAADQSRSVLIVLPPYPTTGRSWGMPMRRDGRPATARNDPPCTSNEQPKFTSTRSCGRGTSQGSGNRSQLSASSRCQPSTIDCRKMPYSYLSPYPIAGRCRVAIDSMKHAARRPKPPFPSPASGSFSSRSGQSRLLCRTAPSATGVRSRFETLLASERPMRNSMER